VNEADRRDPRTAHHHVSLGATRPNIRPGPFTDTVRWSSQGPPATAGVTPPALLMAAHADLADAMGHLDQAAACMTVARVKLTHLV
jgi:hypothetical protein